MKNLALAVVVAIPLLNCYADTTTDPNASILSDIQNNVIPNFLDKAGTEPVSSTGSRSPSQMNEKLQYSCPRTDENNTVVSDTVFVFFQTQPANNELKLFSFVSDRYPGPNTYSPSVVTQPDYIEDPTGSLALASFKLRCADPNAPKPHVEPKKQDASQSNTVLGTSPSEADKNRLSKSLNQELVLLRGKTRMLATILSPSVSYDNDSAYLDVDVNCKTIGKFLNKHLIHLKIKMNFKDNMKQYMLSPPNANYSDYKDTNSVSKIIVKSCTISKGKNKKS